MDQNEHDNACILRARQRGDKTFTLVGQDRSSPKTICFWIMENIETCPADKLLDALKDALLMRETAFRKNAD
jgi:hypothetical protein